MTTTRKPKSEKHVKETLRRSRMDDLLEENSKLRSEVRQLRREKQLVEDELSFERNFSFRAMQRGMPN